MTSVLRLYHSGVVRSWRERERQMRHLGNEVTLVSPRYWNEGGRRVRIDASDRFAVAARSAGRHPFVFVYGPLTVWRQLRRQQWDVIDVHEEPASLAAFEVLVLRALARSRGRVFFYSAENIPKRYPPPFRWFERWALRSASGIYCCNRAAAEIMRSKGFAGELEVLGLGVDVERFAPAPADDHGGLRIGYVGRTDERKGVQIVIEAIAPLADEVTLTVVGTGPYLDDLRLLVEQLDIAHRVELRGFVAHDDLPALYRSFDVVVVPSLPTPRWHEQFCRVAVEAMASGVPVVASDEGALPEVVGDGGVIVPAGDVGAWRAAIEKLTAERELRLELRHRAIERAQSYSWAWIAARHVELYERAAR